MSNVSQLKSLYERSNIIRTMTLVVIALLLQIPIAQIESTIQVRATTKNEAIADVTQKWGRSQTLIGPLLIIPYEHKIYDAEHPKKPPTILRRHITLLPDHLRVSGQLHTEIRSRGIFDVPVYQGNVVLEGDFPQPDLTAAQISPDQILWSDVKLIIGLSDARAIQEQVVMTWNGRLVELQAGTDRVAVVDSGFHAVVSAQATGRPHAFSIPLRLNGGTGFFVAPLGKNSDVSLASDWRDPSFQGNWLPTSRELTQEGFTAQWRIPSLGRNYPQQWAHDDSFGSEVQQSVVGANLIHAVDPYRMSERSVKYQMLFLTLTFAAVWLFEILAGIKVHPMQYLFIGMALCLFYLLELSLSEHLGFVAAYAIASTAIVVMVFGYARVMLRARMRAAVLGGGLALLYTYLFTLLQEQSYSLLAGSIGLFLALGAVMYLTRNVDWYGVARSKEPSDQ